MSKIEQILQREDGSEVKIVAEEFFGMGLTRSIDVYVLARDNTNANWRLAKKDANPNWADMSVQDHEKVGRSEMLELVSRAEIQQALQILEEVAAQSVTNDMSDYEAPRSPARQTMKG
ncbi:hypothetical protein PuT2_15465 [Pusillimonas sp. T2]|uniref:hypothetical protein n=1 Tax=Pusillimonas sp. T2 TaxID=1548123 RepID=UPI000B9D46EB|nr:hypothetical protein [Pusillimonas sp. T2]OXR47889.1 hypothetical protein PuT2_15465 [Pusillimonas sp. T2]